MFRVDRTRVSYVKPEVVYAQVAASGQGERQDETQVEPNQPPVPDLRAEILNEARSEAIADADRITGEARTEAADIISNAESESERIKAEAYSLGYEEGRADGLRSLDAQKDEYAQAVASLMSEINDSRGQMIDSLEDDILTLVFNVARKVIMTEIDRNDTAFLNIVKNALSGIKSGGKLSVMLSNADFERFFPDGNASFVINNDTVIASVSGKGHLNRGDCIVESEGETIEAGVDSQLRGIELAFKKEETTSA